MVLTIDPETKEIEILKVGEHTAMNGTAHDFTHEIAQQIVDSYNPDNFKAPLIVSHRTGGYGDRDIVNSELAFGTPKTLKKVGDRVRAVFEKISPQFVDWTRNHEILGISPSFYPPDHPSNPAPGEWSLRHIAGLGKSPPAIKGLASLSLSEFMRGDVGAIDLGEFEMEAIQFTSHKSQVTSPDSIVTCDLKPVTLDFMGMGNEHFVTTLFQRLRDYLIDKEGLEAADRIIAPDYLQMMTQIKVEPDYPMEMIDRLMGRVQELESRFLPNSNYQIYSEQVESESDLNSEFRIPNSELSFAASKMFGQSKKKKNCIKGTSCGNSCISASKACKQKATPEQKNKVKELKGSIKSSGGSISNDSISATSVGTAATTGKTASGQKGQSKQTKNSGDTVPASTANKIHAIKSQSEFEDVALHTFDKLSKKHDGLVPIYELRRAIGETVPRDKFNEYMFEMQATDKLLFQGGSLPSGAKDQLQDSLSSAVSGYRVYATLDMSPEKLSAAIKNKTAKVETLLKDRPELDPLGSASTLKSGAKIKTSSEFEKNVNDAFDRLNKEFIYSDIVPISKLRSALGDRVSKKDFDSFLLKMQENDKLQLQTSQIADTDEEKNGIKISGIGGTRTHAMKRLK